MFKKIAVFGPGLLGGSICRGIRRADLGVSIAAYGRDAGRLKPALDEGIVDSVDVMSRASLAGVDLAVVATPVDSSIDIIKRILESEDLGPSAIVIDVGSVKEKVVRSVAGLERAGRFIGCHPMAGSEKMGFQHSRHDLFNGAFVIITPHGGNSEVDIRRVRELWERLGATTFVVTPDEHDIIAAYTSHMPHMAASAMVRVFDNFRSTLLPAAEMAPFIGRGFLDVTRISSGSPDMWRDIAALNREHIIAALDHMIQELALLRRTIAGSEGGESDVHTYLARAKVIRDGLK
ncbi:MAG: prephenate dehydrogenase/arogenate dehydrogenase family protein [Spirochaetes bacterium]|nr:prephenate dehydrogenase/arogenate dehydrogenase family protein [Spirochaetota bacterium]